jgi:hypothetical protein
MKLILEKKWSEEQWERMKKLEAMDELIKIKASGDLPSDEIETACRKFGANFC